MMVKRREERRGMQSLGHFAMNTMLRQENEEDCKCVQDIYNIILREYSFL